MQDRLQFFGNGIAYLKLDLLVGGAVAVGSYVKAHDLLQRLPAADGTRGEDWRFRKGSAPQCRRGASGGRKLKCRLELTSMLVPKCISGLRLPVPGFLLCLILIPFPALYFFSFICCLLFFQFCRISKLLYTDTHCPLRYSIHFKPFTALSESTECSFRFPTHSTSPPVSPPLFFSPGCHKFRTGTHRRTPPVFRSAP